MDLFICSRAWWLGEPLPAPPTAAQRVAMYWRHLNLYLAENEETRAVLEMRKFAGWYFKPDPTLAPLLPEINRRTRVSDIQSLLNL